MNGATRRDFLGGAVAGAATPLLLHGASAQAAGVTPVRQVIVRRGRAVAVSPDGRRLVVAHDMRDTISIVAGGRRRLVDVGGHPVAVAVSPDGALAAVATASWMKPRVLLVSTTTGKVRSRHTLGAAPRDVLFTADGEHLVVIGGEQEGTLHVLDIDGARLEPDHRVVLGRVPRGVVVAPDHRRAWVTLEADDRIVGVDLKRGRIVRELRTPALPDRLAISPRGRRLLVTHGGGDRRVSEILLDSGRVHRHDAGRLPSAVAWTRGDRRLVALGGEAAVLELGRNRRRRVAPAPRDIAVAGRRFWTVSALSAGTSGGRL